MLDYCLSYWFNFNVSYFIWNPGFLSFKEFSSSELEEYESEMGIKLFVAFLLLTTYTEVFADTFVAFDKAVC